MKNLKGKNHKISVLPSRSEEELQTLLLKNDAILSAVPDIIMEVDADKIYTWANQAGLDFFGEDVVGKEASYYFEGDQDTYEKVQPLFNGDENVIYVESWQRRRDGEKRLLAWSCRVTKDIRGEVVGAVSTARDITEQIRVEERNRLEKYLLENTIESIPHPFYVIDANNYRIVMANKATAVFGNVTENSTCHELTHNRDAPCSGAEHRCPLDIVKRTKKPVTLEHVHYDKDGNPRTYEVFSYPILDDEDNVVRMIEYGLDITDRKLAEEKLRESEERFGSVLHSAHDAIISIDGAGTITFWNEKAETMFGYSDHEAIGSPITIIIPARFRDQHREGINRVISTGESKLIGSTTEITGLRKDGVEFPVELSLAKGETAKEVFFTGILRDITKRKQAEMDLRLANRRMKNDLEAAAQVQRSLLPKERLELRGVRCASAFKPCEELGGDIFNVFQLDDRHLGLYILDVSGHGVPAALLSVTLSRIISSPGDRSSLLKQQTADPSEYHLVRPSEVAGQLNKQFPMDPDKVQYFTLIYGILDLTTFELRYINAGHPGPIYLPRNSEPTVLEKGAVPIGVFAESVYEEYSVILKPGDRLYLYSDGITEAANTNDDHFGEKRLTAVLDHYRGKALSDSISFILDENLEQWRAGVRLNDDVSILGIEITESDDYFDPGI
jgi:PAS domain S-box-containing protein